MVEIGAVNIHISPSQWLGKYSNRNLRQTSSKKVDESRPETWIKVTPPSEIILALTAPIDEMLIILSAFSAHQPS